MKKNYHTMAGCDGANEGEEEKEQVKWCVNFALHFTQKTHVTIVNQVTQVSGFFPRFGFPCASVVVSLLLYLA
jgi:hypothetical protein